MERAMIYSICTHRHITVPIIVRYFQKYSDMCKSHDGLKLGIFSKFFHIVYKMSLWTLITTQCCPKLLHVNNANIRRNEISDLFHLWGLSYFGQFRQYMVVSFMGSAFTFYLILEDEIPTKMIPEIYISSNAAG